MIASMVHQLTKNATVKEMDEAGLGSMFTEHGKGVYPTDASGVPFSVS